MEAFLKAQGLKGATLRTQLDKALTTAKFTNVPHPRGQKAAPSPDGDAFKGELPLGFDGPSLDADLAWHVRAWGRWVLERERKDLERFYPTLDRKPTSRLSLGANGEVQELPCNDAATEDQMALQERQQAHSTKGRAERRPTGSSSAS